jgi:predicted small integral membrane protein
VPEFPENGDYFFLSFILNMLINLVILGFTIIFLDAFWISRCGATPGKMLMGLVVMDKNGERPSRATAKARAISFLGGGLYYMLLFPVFQVVGAVSAWKKRNDIQPWDGVIGTQVLQKPISKLKAVAVSIIGIMLILTTVIYIQVGKQEYQQQMLDESHERQKKSQKVSYLKEDIRL